MRVEFLARLFFFRSLSLPGLEELVLEQQAVCRAQVERFDRLAAQSDDDFHRLVLEFRRGQLAAAIRWLDRCLEFVGLGRYAPLAPNEASWLVENQA
jgi:hypothetical protein